MPKTKENLRAAFAGESQANRRYLAFARQAAEQGKRGLAKLFRAAAEGETVHALNHLAAANGVKTAEENLETAIAGETYEIETMYPEFIAAAAEENERQALDIFGEAKKVESIHQKLFREALEPVSKGGDIPEVEYYICQVCGNPEIGQAPDRCPICGSPKEKFVKSA